MKRIIWLCLLPGLMSSVEAQVVKSSGNPGKVSGKIYTNFNVGLNGDHSTAFEITRAYFGYERDLDDHFSAGVKLDIGSPDDVSEYSLIRRYTYFKNAYVSYHRENFQAWFGLFDMLQFKVQEKFWGYRYIYKSYMDEYRFGPSADIGAGAEYTFSRYLTADLIISNGEGYKNLQFDNTYKIGTGWTLHPLRGLTLRTYFTVHTRKTAQMSFMGFAGYRMEKLRMGAEYIHQVNYRFNEGHNRYGYSLFSTYTFNRKWEVFGRYDQLYSNIIPEDDIPWNLTEDGSAVVGGVQFTPIPALHIAANYQDWVEFASNGSSSPYFYIHLEINF